MKCPNCGNTQFYGHQIVRMNVTVDENNNFVDSGEIYDSETPYGPFTCTKCEKEFDDAELFEK